MHGLAYIFSTTENFSNTIFIIVCCFIVSFFIQVTFDDNGTYIVTLSTQTGLANLSFIVIVEDIISDSSPVLSPNSSTSSPLLPAVIVTSSVAAIAILFIAVMFFKNKIVFSKNDDKS